MVVFAGRAFLAAVFFWEDLYEFGYSAASCRH